MRKKKWHWKVNFEKDLSPFTQAQMCCIYLRTSGISGLFLKRDDVLINGLPWSPCSSGAFFGNVFTFDGDFAAVISLWSPFSSVSLLLLLREGLLGVCSFCLCVCCWPVWLIFLCLEALLSWGSKTAFLFDCSFFCNINTDSTALHNQAEKELVCKAEYISVWWKWKQKVQDWLTCAHFSADVRWLRSVFLWNVTGSEEMLSISMSSAMSVSRRLFKMWRST